MNKSIIYLIIVIFFTTAYNCSYSQNIPDNQQAIEMLKEFYIAQSKIKSTPQDIHKMDSLQKKYCSKQLQDKLNKQFRLTGLDHDLLTNDYGIDSLGVKTLIITNDPKQNNGFIVTYTILDDVVPNVSKKEIHVVIYVTVQNDKGILKVDDIK